MLQSQKFIFKELTKNIYQMKLFRYNSDGNAKPGVFNSLGHFDVGDYVNDYDEDFLTNNELSSLQNIVNNKKLMKLNESEIEFLPPIHRPGKIVCVGLNYAKHAKESGMEIPKEPLLFFKATSSLVGPFDDIVIPKNSQKTDWEVELGLVIGKKASYITKENAMDYLAGYTLHNDVSERDFQINRGGQWVKGKSCDTFAPMGPYLVTKDEITNPHNLDIWLKRNGEIIQQSNTQDLIFDIPTLISYISQFMSLMPGDIISTGTPSGVGFGMNPQQYLKAGDVVELGIDGLGSSKQHVRAYNADTI